MSKTEHKFKVLWTNECCGYRYLIVSDREEVKVTSGDENLAEFNSRIKALRFAAKLREGLKPHTTILC